MRIPLEISYHGLSRSESLEKLVNNDVAKLERVCDNLISCRVGIKLEQKSRRTSNPFRVRIEMRMPPGHDLVVNHTSGLKEDSEDLHAAVKNAFKSAHRRLKQQVEKQQGNRKNHPQQEVVALITKIFSEEGYGFLRSTEGEEVYFHRNSVINYDFDRLKPGDGVQYSAELGDKGLQATSVQVVERRGKPAEEPGTDVISEPLGWKREIS
jgi:cold shock CspA family protein/ribosome-associated translation inhibitor RaiA